METTESTNEEILTILSANEPVTDSRVGQENMYLDTLFKNLQGLQNDCTNVDGFDLAHVRSLGAEEVPDYSPFGKVCTCLELGADKDWKQNSFCREGISDVAAEYSEEGKTDLFMMYFQSTTRIATREMRESVMKDIKESGRCTAGRKCTGENQKKEMGSKCCEGLVDY